MKHSILIVEDEAALANPWQKMLRGEGYDVDVACDGEEGWNQWREKPYDVILLDLKMPRLSGGDLLERIHQRQPMSQVIIISGEGTETDKLRAVNLHAFSYLEKKDVGIKEIKKCLTEALAQRNLLLQSLEALVDNSADPDKPILAVGRHEYSAQQLFDEARMGTDFGMKYLAGLQKTMVKVSAKRRVDQPFAADGVFG